MATQTRHISERTSVAVAHGIHWMTLAWGVISVALVGPVDCGPSAPAPCSPRTSGDACGCCLQGEVRVCPAGVPVPDAGVITLPVCGG